MNREILFRGRRVDNGEWVFGNYCEETCFGRKPIPSIQTIEKTQKGCVCKYEMELYEVDQTTVGQFTGMMSWEQCEVFEGDVVRFYTETGIEDFEVAWCDMLARFALKKNGNGWSEYAEMVDIHGGEVTGNIYDNPELMKGGAE